jgi:DUF1009 family protein
MAKCKDCTKTKGVFDYSSGSKNFYFDLGNIIPDPEQFVEEFTELMKKKGIKVVKSAGFYEDGNSQGSATIKIPKEMTKEEAKKQIRKAFPNLDFGDLDDDDDGDDDGDNDGDDD